jgi:hypothetical protein
MRHGVLAFGLLAAVLTAPTASIAQTDIVVPGGATGANVFCLQAGDLTSGAFVGSYLQTGPRMWEERLRAGVFKLQERRRDDLSVELFDAQRSATIQLDFVSKTIKYKPANSQQPSGTDRYYILNATDQAASVDCAALAAASGPADTAAARAPNGPGLTIVQIFQVPPRIVINVPPGTQFTATQGPPCPGNPGFFLCPNRFSCAPLGGVCCPGAHACNGGTFCDKFVRNFCIGPGNPRFCAGTGDVRTGSALHCPVGKTCVGNRCV